VMALCAVAIGIGVVGFEAIAADTGWAYPSRTPSASATDVTPTGVMPTGSSAGRSGPVTSPTTLPPEVPSTEPTATPSETPSRSVSGDPSPSVSGDPTPSTSTQSGSSQRHGSAGDRTPVGRYQGSRVIPPASPTGTTGAVAVPPRSPAPADQGGEIPVQAGYVSRAVAQGLIIGGTAGFMVSIAGMMLVGWIRRRV